MRCRLPLCERVRRGPALSSYPRVAVSEWCNGMWHHYGQERPTVTTREHTTVAMMLTTDPWSTEAKQDGARTAPTPPLRYRIHL